VKFRGAAQVTAITSTMLGLHPCYSSVLRTKEKRGIFEMPRLAGPLGMPEIRVIGIKLSTHKIPVMRVSHVTLVKRKMYGTSGITVASVKSVMRGRHVMPGTRKKSARHESRTSHASRATSKKVRRHARHVRQEICRRYVMHVQRAKCAT
jgi:hypothetical protein